MQAVCAKHRALDAKSNFRRVTHHQNRPTRPPNRVPYNPHQKTELVAISWKHNMGAALTPAELHRWRAMLCVRTLHGARYAQNWPIFSPGF